MLSSLLLVWAAPTPETVIRYRDFAMAENTPNSDYSATNVLCWNDTYPQEIAFFDTRATVRFAEEDGTFYYLAPVGSGPIRPAMDALRAEAAARGEALRLVGVTEPQLEVLRAAYGDAFEAEAKRDYADYLYTAESLDTLAGKKLHGKRNHINAFIAAHDWQVVPLTSADFPACRAILEAWDGQHEGETVKAEHLAVGRAFDVFEQFSFTGALLVVDGIPVAFTMGEKISADTFCVHFEKTSPDFVGAYPLINREFVRMTRAADPTVAFINREEDMGLPNLRAAKLSYHPVRLVEKYTLSFRV